MAVMSSQPESTVVEVASTSAPAPGEERNGNGVELNGHVSPATSEIDATKSINTKSVANDDAPSQDLLKSTETSNKDAFTSNQSVSAMTPPNGDTIASNDASTNSAPAESVETKDTEMTDAPTESAKPPSPPAEPVADLSEAATDKAARSDEPPPKPAQSPPPVEGTKTGTDAAKSEVDAATEIEKAGAAHVAIAESGKEGIDIQVPNSTGAQPSDLVTPTTSMSNMALDASREAAAAPVTVDTSMTDAPSQSSTKIARERDEEEDEEPAAKRARTSGEQEAGSTQAATKAAVAPDAMNVDPPTDPSAAAPAAKPTPTPATAPATQPEPQSISSKTTLFLNDVALESEPVTPYRAKEIRKVLGLVKKTKFGTHFRQSVKSLWPQVWDQYSKLITKPMDISLIENNLRAPSVYNTMGEFKRDVELLQENAATFNGATHDVTAWARATVSQVYERLATIPANEPPKPPKQEPKQMPTRHAEPRNPPAPKKEARPPATSPADKTNDSQIYALLPSGIPNIRRDSTKNDGDRPKRPIHPPKNKDLGFQPKTTKTKKNPEQKFFEEVLKEVSGPKHRVQNQWFLEPVDPVALNIPTYFSVVKQPMDLGTMNEKLQMGEYATAKDFKSDFGLIVKNCVKFNGEENPVSICAKELNEIFEKKWSERANWLSKHAQSSAPPAATTSPRGGARDETDDEEASEAEQPDSANADVRELERAIDALTSRLKQEQVELDKKVYSAVPDMLDIEMARGIITHLQNQMVEKRQALAKLLENTKKGPQPKASKKKAAGSGAVGGGATSGGSKKTGGTSASAKKNTGGGAPAKKPVKKKLNDEEKEIVSEAIARLEANALDKAIAIIKKDTGLKTEDDELELDMDQLSDDALVKLFELVIKAFPAYKDQLKKNEPAPAPVHSTIAAKSSKPKKNKPMGKAEQERKLEQLRELKKTYKRPGSGSQEPLPSVENNEANLPNNQHNDSDDASSSEEE